MVFVVKSAISGALGMPVKSGLARGALLPIAVALVLIAVALVWQHQILRLQPQRWVQLL